MSGVRRARHWGAQRSRARGPVVLALAALVLVTSGVLTGIAGWTALAGREGLRDYLESATGADSTLQLRTRLGEAGQAEAASDFFDRTVGDLPVRVERSVAVSPRQVGDRRVRFAALDEPDEHATLVDGEWPRTAVDGTVPVAVPLTQARALGVELGDALDVEGIGRMRVVGTWQARQLDDPVLEELASDGQDRTGLPLLVPEDALADLYPFVAWTLTPDTDRIGVDDVAALSRGVDALPEAFDDEPGLASAGVLSGGALGETLRTLDRSQQAALAVRPVPVVVVAALAVLMVLQLAGLLARQRAPETALLRSRGASGGQLTRLALAEAAVLAVVPAALGAGATALVLALADEGIPLLGWVLGAGTAAVALVAVAAPAILQNRRTADRQQIDDSGRGVALSAGATVVAVTLAAAVATWRFRSLGSATFRDASGVTRVDPLAVLAPGLLLLAGALCATALFAAAAVVVERSAARRPGLAVALGARQVARRATTYGVLVLLLSVAVGATALAASYSSTQPPAQDRLDALGNGAPVRVTLPVQDPVSPSTYDGLVPRLRGLDAVTTALTVQDATVSVGSTEARLLGVAAGDLAGVLPGAISDLGDDLAAARQEPRGWPLPDGTGALDLRLVARGTPGDTTLSVAVWVQAPDGSVQALAAGQVEVAAGGTSATRDLQVRVPGLDDGSRVVALDVTAARDTRPQDLEVRLDALTARTEAGTEVVPTEPWELYAGLDDPDERAAALTDSPGWRLDGAPGASLALRLVPPGGDAPLPVVVDTALADELGLGRGDTLQVGVDAARRLPSRVVDVVDRLPGGQALPAVGADLTALSQALLARSFSVPSAGEVWVGTDDESRSAAEIGELLPPGAGLVRASSRSAQGVVAPASSALWIGAVGTLVLALVGALCVTASAAEARRDELVVLRAVGLGARAQGRARLVELAAVVGTGVVLGLVVSAVVTWLVVPGLAGSTLVGDSPVTPTPEIAPLALALPVAALVALVLVAVGAHARRTRLDAAASTPSEVRR